MKERINHESHEKHEKKKINHRYTQMKRCHNICVDLCSSVVKNKRPRMSDELLIFI